ncbi:GNAT family N-acetyltransferase [Paenibacillus glycanilyticus]|uniref:N-acetyltransferase n=1 Tax=Paenibacillus glycanilyticus TaxID=126569 RepID=A0ABQ6GAN8_9BACL|nr:GNAT family N-acetyltransferase [Paenibacillus glycanilyticus]GLX68044.1 N-acetyltransferase [Paenibacillus glycanilyticus]
MVCKVFIGEVPKLNEFIIITKVKQLDIYDLTQLVDESTSEGFRHLKRLVGDYEAGTNKFDMAGEALFLAIKHGEIVGVCGLNQGLHANSSKVGRVRRLYVSPNARRFGVGRMLMNSVIAEARNHYQMLVLKTDNPVADLFYRSIGFLDKADSEIDTHFLELSSLKK